MKYDKEHMHECSPQYLRMGTASMKYDKETEEEGKHKREHMEENKVVTK